MLKTTFVSITFLVLLSFSAIFAPYVAPYSYDEQNISQKLEGPSHHHWMGTDSLGRDLGSRVIYGARISLAIGVFTAIFALCLGTLVGAIAGFWGGWVDVLLMRCVDFLSIFPATLLAILLMLIVGRGAFGIFVALGVTSWLTQARLVRGQVLQAREMNYVESARALGATQVRIVIQHILPNIFGPLIVSLTIQVPANILAESFLSFIGLGLQPPYSSWGTLANEGFRAMETYPHLILFPGGILFLTMLSFSAIGDELSVRSSKGL